MSDHHQRPHGMYHVSSSTSLHGSHGSPYGRNLTGNFFISADLQISTFYVPEDEYNKKRRESILFALDWLNKNVLYRSDIGYHLRKHIQKGIEYDDSTHKYLMNSCLHWKEVLANQGRKPITCPTRISYRDDTSPHVPQRSRSDMQETSYIPQARKYHSKSTQFRSSVPSICPSVPPDYNIYRS